MSPVKRPSAVASMRQAAAPAAGEVRSHDDPALPSAQPPRRPPKEPTTRYTLDLDRAHHLFLKQFALEAELRGAAEVMRALLDELQEDPALADRIRARVWEGKR